MIKLNFLSALASSFKVPLAFFLLLLKIIQFLSSYLCILCLVILWLDSLRGSLYKATTLWPSSPPPPFVKFLFSLPSFLFNPFKVFQIVALTLMQPLPALGLNRFKQISKGWFYQFNCCFPSKINFDFLHPFTNISGYLDQVFRFIFSHRRMTFLLKIIVAEKNYFSSNA